MDNYRLRNAILNAASRNAALVIKNANIVNVFTGTIEQGDVAIRDGIILGIGNYSGREEIDAKGAYLCPGLIDGHVHIESSMAHPSRFADCVLQQGTTTVIADPHEIANACGTDGIQYMLDQTEWLPLSVLSPLFSLKTFQLNIKDLFRTASICSFENHLRLRIRKPPDADQPKFIRIV